MKFDTTDRAPGSHSGPYVLRFERILVSTPWLPMVRHGHGFRRTVSLRRKRLGTNRIHISPIRFWLQVEAAGLHTPRRARPIESAHLSPLPIPGALCVSPARPPSMLQSASQDSLAELAGEAKCATASNWPSTYASSRTRCILQNRILDSD